MPTFEFHLHDGRVVEVDAKDQDAATAGLKHFKEHGAKPISPAADFAKSMPTGAVNSLSSLLSAGGQAAGLEMSQPETAASMPTPAEAKDVLQGYTGQLHEPVGRMGRLGASVGGALANPTTYLTPGGIMAKMGWGVGSGLGEEAAGQGAEAAGAGPVGQSAARLVGNTLGGTLSTIPQHIAAMRAMSANTAKQVAAETAGVSGGPSPTPPPQPQPTPSPGPLQTPPAPAPMGADQVGDLLKMVPGNAGILARLAHRGYGILNPTKETPAPAPAPQAPLAAPWGPRPTQTVPEVPMQPPAGPSPAALRQQDQQTILQSMPSIQLLAAQEKAKRIALAQDTARGNQQTVTQAMPLLNRLAQQNRPQAPEDPLALLRAQIAERRLRETQSKFDQRDAGLQEAAAEASNSPFLERRVGGADAVSNPEAGKRLAEMIKHANALQRLRSNPEAEAAAAAAASAAPVAPTPQPVAPASPVPPAPQGPVPLSLNVFRGPGGRFIGRQAHEQSQLAPQVAPPAAPDPVAAIKALTKVNGKVKVTTAPQEAPTALVPTPSADQALADAWRSARDKYHTFYSQDDARQLDLMHHTGAGLSAEDLPGHVADNMMANWRLKGSQGTPPVLDRADYITSTYPMYKGKQDLAEHLARELNIPVEKMVAHIQAIPNRTEARRWRDAFTHHEPLIAGRIESIMGDKTIDGLWRGPNARR